MDIGQEKKGDVLVISVKGKLDRDTSPLLLDRLVTTVDGGEKQIIVDLAELEYINSQGLRTLVLAAKKLKTMEAKIVLAALPDHIKEVFNIAGLISVFPLASSLKEAHAQFP